MSPSPPKWKTIMVESGYGFNTRQPFIEIKDERLKAPLQLSPEEARDLALNLLEAAEAAEQDAFMIEYAKGQIGTDDRGAAALVMEFRKWRKQHGMNK